MKTYDVLKDLEAWLEKKIIEHTPLNNLTSSSYLSAYKSVKYKLNELYEEHE